MESEAMKRELWTCWEKNTYNLFIINAGSLY